MLEKEEGMGGVADTATGEAPRLRACCRVRVRVRARARMRVRAFVCARVLVSAVCSVLV